MNSENTSRFCKFIPDRSWTLFQPTKFWKIHTKFVGEYVEENFQKVQTTYFQKVQMNISVCQL